MRPSELPSRTRWRASDSQFSLARLDVHRYDVFTVCSDVFWRTRRSLVTSFFAHLRSVNGSGFLVAPAPSICQAAMAQIGVQCVAVQHYRHDGALSKERWRVLLHSVRQGHRLMYAGLDMRFLQPIPRVFDAVRTDAAVDAAFEGRYIRHLSRVRDFTPDLIAAFPTPRLINFFERIVNLLRARSTDGLPRYMRVPQLLGFNLMGPAEQDLLRDALLSTLYNRSVVARKYDIAIQAAMTMCKDARMQCIAPAINLSLPRCPSAGGAALSTASPLHWACAGTGILAENVLGKLPYQATPHGGVDVRMPALSIHLTDRSVLRPVQWERHCQSLAASQCQGPLDEAPPLAVHCTGKDPSCLDLSRCACFAARATTTSNTHWGA